MTSRFWLEVQRASGVERRDVKPPDEFGGPGLVDGECPGCGCKRFLVRGSDLRPAGHDVVMSNGRAVCCGDPVGYLFGKVDTLFGAEEDRNMLDKDHVRARVYR